MSAGFRIASALIGAMVLGAEGPGSAPVPPPLGDPPPPLSDAAFDAAFICPEALVSDDARRQAMVVYFHWAQARHPDWSIADAVEYKKTLLIRHQCTQSLRDLADYAKREYR
jgi:hypothetical protein